MRDKVVIITGASSGIGKALARRFGKEGAKVVLAARRIEKLHELESQLKGVDTFSVKTDVSLEEDCKNLIEKTIKKYGQIDILINNAGISMRSLFDYVEIGVLKRLMNVNFWGTVYCSKYALPYLKESKGSLVGVISVAAYVGLPGRTGYSASKFAIRGFLETLRIENLKNGVHVLVAAPGFTASEIRQYSLNANGEPQGDSPRDENKMMSADECAGHIFKAIKKRKRELILTFWEGKFSVFLNKICPKIIDRLTYSHLAKEPGSPFK